MRNKALLVLFAALGLVGMQMQNALHLYYHAHLAHNSPITDAAIQNQLNHHPQRVGYLRTIASESLLSDHTCFWCISQPGSWHSIVPASKSIQIYSHEISTWTYSNVFYDSHGSLSYSARAPPHLG